MTKRQPKAVSALMECIDPKEILLEIPFKKSAKPPIKGTRELAGKRLSGLIIYVRIVEKLQKSQKYQFRKFDFYAIAGKVVHGGSRFMEAGQGISVYIGFDKTVQEIKIARCKAI